MKTCPKCRAEIQDNANFCLYCMTSFDQKETVVSKTSSPRRWAYLVAAILALLIAVSCIVAAISGVFSDNSASYQKETSAPSASTFTSSSASSSSPTESSEPDKKPASSTPSSGNEASSEGGSSSENQTPSQDEETPATTPSGGQTTPPSSDNEEEEETPTSPGGSSSETPPAQTTPPETEPSVTYEYRPATFGDDYNSYATIPTDAIVITKVTSASENGVYDIPQSIDGKTVIAIMENAFGSPEIKDTVKTVIIPESIKTIWSYGFFYCHNLKSLYIKGEALFIGDAPFAPVARRNETITIYCSETCHNRNFTKWKNLALYNDALYVEWNG